MPRLCLSNSDECTGCNPCERCYHAVMAIAFVPAILGVGTTVRDEVRSILAKVWGEEPANAFAEVFPDPAGFMPQSVGIASFTAFQEGWKRCAEIVKAHQQNNAQEASTTAEVAEEQPVRKRKRKPEQPVSDQVVTTETTETEHENGS